MRSISSLLVLIFLLATITNSITNFTSLDPSQHNGATTGAQLQDFDSAENVNSTDGSMRNGTNITESIFAPLDHDAKLIKIPSKGKKEVIVPESTSSMIETIILYLLIVIGGVALGMVAIVVCCCCMERRRMHRLTTEMSDKPEDLPIHPVNRPLILENNANVDDNIPFDPPSPGQPPVIERMLPDPFTPVKYIVTPMNDNEAQMTAVTEMQTPIDRKNQVIETPAKEVKMAELHIEEYK
ncbi:hypothetical protein PFISCL1PPCAC_2110 [Pristionchus fissidentatus]|uniref:Uncharacterized protein n=1 Tax=Pristionchus fissidentatus TaxID=1538716 RepID=A0AAV5UXB4_9BILA|nr:hypothetical protein PFISCL1PPCAC_2110 [Pristionchus fissidentatus]